ncbi:DUF881 domain-containing protein [Nocardioides mesophilus]|uniref:DUF881 domain-containing protein n=1 Tax=Nocardioides mesophilus TaxID=433659 RepID=A0A7G9RAR7_9ACTN|nr:DUF881 domain-containing protein [Nocardioides mesophilus]
MSRDRTPEQTGPAPEPDEVAPGQTGPATEPPRDGRQRLLASLRRPGGRGQVTAAILLAVLGFAAVVQVQSNQQDATYVGARQDELIALINSLSLATQRAENEIAQLEQTRSSLLNDTEARRTALERARERADQLGILAGTLPAVGPGIRITVEDDSGAVGANNLINGIQELRDSGAEAIEINDQVRVVAQTAVRDLAEGACWSTASSCRPPTSSRRSATPTPWPEG